MKAYIGTKIMCLAAKAPVDEGGQEGYNVLYSDGSETWLTKEVFDYEFRLMTEDENQMIISTIIDLDDEDTITPNVNWDEVVDNSAKDGDIPLEGIDVIDETDGDDGAVYELVDKVSFGGNVDSFVEETKPEVTDAQ